MISLLVLISALILDRLLGEPRVYHPLIGYGNFASFIEKIMNLCKGSRLIRRGIGVFALLVSTLPFLVIAIYLSSLHFLFDLLMLTLAIGWQSLREHGIDIRNALVSNDIPLARKNLRKVVSRDTAQLNETEICSASVESILENGNDAIFSAIFWFLIAGGPGVLLFRLVNTLDAMWGYKTSRYLHFGWAAARLDDVMNYIPARLTALSYYLTSLNYSALQCWSQQAKHWKSSNAGAVMASGAGSLNVKLGGIAYYNGKAEDRPMLGTSNLAKTSDIDAAINLISLSLKLWVATLIFIMGAQFYAGV